MSGIVVVLSGGGGRALAHLGVLEVLEDAGIPIERIVGVSAGAVLGALYGLYGARPAQERVIELLEGSELSGATRKIARMQSARSSLRGRIRRFFGYARLMLKQGIVSKRHLMRAMAGLVGSSAFDDLRVPLTVVASDLYTGREVALGSGPLMKVLAGTSALPGVFEPVPAGDRLLVDSGDVNALPVHVARRYRPAFTLAIDVSRGKMPPPRLHNGVEVQARARDAAALMLRDVESRLADFVIRPRVLRRDWSDFTNPEDAFLKGRVAAKRRLARLHAGLCWKEIVPCRTE